MYSYQLEFLVLQFYTEREIWGGVHCVMPGRGADIVRKCLIAGGEMCGYITSCLR